MNPKIIFANSSFRIIATDEQFHVEQSNGVDMMGVTRWFSWDAGTVDRDGGEDAHEAIKIPASVFAALCRSHECRSPSSAPSRDRIERALCNVFSLPHYQRARPNVSPSDLATDLAAEIAHIGSLVSDLAAPTPDLAADLREALIVELTRANGNREESADMVRRIEAGTFALNDMYSQKAHALLAALLAL